MQHIELLWPSSRPSTALRHRLMHWGALRLGGLASAWATLEQAMAQPARFQAKLLGRILQANRDSAYGRAHGFAALNSVTAFQARVPRVDDDALQPWLAKVAAGHAGVLTQERVLGLRGRSGHSGEAAPLPLTAGLLQQEGQVLRAWAYDWLQHDPQLLQGRVYIELPPAPSRAPTAGPGLVSGLAALLPSSQRLLAEPLLALPTAQASWPEDAWDRMTLQGLLDAGDLDVMWVRSPQRLLALMAQLEAQLPQFLEALPPERAAGILARMANAGRLQAQVLWPRLRAVACWQDGPAAAAMPQLRGFCAGVPLLPAPVQSRAGTLTLPLRAAAMPPLAINGHFFEFVDLDARRQPPLLAHQLRPGGTYMPLITTAAGLYRYQLNEALTCHGSWRGLPQLSYVDRTTPESSLSGEFLRPHRVQQALADVERDHNLRHRFALCVPDTRSAHHRYVLYLESDAEPEVLAQAAAALETALCRDHAYWLGRQNGHLQPLHLASVQDGWSAYSRGLAELGLQRSRGLPSALDTAALWHDVFQTAA